jgi:hypothetical protein
MAALQTMMSTWPQAAMVWSISAWHSGLRPMLQASAMAVPPFAVMASTTSWQASTLREDTTTFAPCSAMRSQMARPMPRLRR